MADYNPPTENLPIFDKTVFITGDIYLTQAQADNRYLRYPSAQGTENLLTINVNGTANFNSSSIFNGSLLANSTSEFKRHLNMNDTLFANNRRITTSFYNFYNSGTDGTLTQNGTLYNNAGAMYLQNTTNGGNINFVLNDAGGTQNTPLQLLSSGNVSNRPLTISVNNNLNMPLGTGILSQGIPTGSTTQNVLKRTNMSINSNSATGSGITALEVFDEVNGKGVFILPNIGSGALGNTAVNNDCAFISRSSQNSNALCFANWNSNFKNGMRIYTTDINNAGLTLQCGQNTSNDWAEFRMEYNRTTDTRTISFNNPINFNPTTPFVIPSTRRQLLGLGTLSFTDNLNGASTGTITSTIYTDSTLVGGLNGMYYDCGINGGFHQFSARDGSGNVSTPIYYGASITSVSNTFIVRNATTTSNRFDISVDGSQNINIRGRSSTASTNAKININCDTVNAGGTVTNQAVLSINPTYLEMRRPIQFNYITRPGSLTQLGYIETLIFDATTISASASVRNFGNFVLADPGTYTIEIIFSLVGSASHNLTTCVLGCSDTSTDLSTVDTPTKYTTSLVGFNTISLSSTTTSYLKINFNVNYTGSSNTVYVNYILNFSGGGTTTIDASGTATRIG